MKSHPVRLKDSLVVNISGSNKPMSMSWNFCREIFQIKLGMAIHAQSSLKLARSTREFSDHLRCAAKLNIAQSERLIDL